MKLSSSELELVKSFRSLLLSKSPSIDSPDLTLGVAILIGACDDFLNNPVYKED